MDVKEWVMPTHIIAAAGVVLNDKDEVPTKLMLDFICKAKGGEPRPSDENSESKFVPKDEVLALIKAPAIIERYKAFLEYNGRPIYMSYVTKPEFVLNLKMNI